MSKGLGDPHFLHKTDLKVTIHEYKLFMPIV